ncbi:hypothetical protein PVAP13_3NG196000 [Panicum virgatum]|uniref:Uncharacterized protein n=2 Tax=Panicum virgatum TaxID=38727 RepID=A0A8T0U5Q7_PANVG|nr:hypothetical protein PVAP13_3NG196000 [Panicum virgatum]KAG2619982.1 hypothetical protein PVAP13_3NG196000 [Panicum virgatum]
MDVNSDAMAQRRPLAACPGQARAPAISACCIHSPVILFIKWMNNLKVYKELICVQGPFGRSPNGTEPPPAARGFVNGESEERKKDSSDQPAMLQ